MSNDDECVDMTIENNIITKEPFPVGDKRRYASTITKNGEVEEVSSELDNHPCKSSNSEDTSSTSPFLVIVEAYLLLSPTGKGSLVIILS